VYRPAIVGRSLGENQKNLTWAYSREIIKYVSLCLVGEDNVCRYRKRHASNERDEGGYVRHFCEAVYGRCT